MRSLYGRGDLHPASRPMAEPILMIEDDRRLAEMVATYLGGNGFAVAVAGSGEAGLAALGGRRDFAAVLLDLMLPDADGLEICRRIREVSPPGRAGGGPGLS